MVYLRFCPGLMLRLFTVVAIALSFWARPGLAAVPQAPARSITVVVPEKFPPLIYRDDSGEVRGMTRDLWALWETRTGIHVDLQPMPWAQALKRVQAGQADVIDLIAFTEARKNVFDFSEPYLVLDVVLFFDKSITGIVDASSSKGLLVGVGDGDACGQTLIAAGSTNLKPYPTIEALVSAATMGEVRVFCAHLPLANFLLNRLGKAGEFRHTPPLYSAPGHWAVPKGHPETTRLVSDGFAQITPAERQAIADKWTGTPVATLDAPLYLRYAGYTFLALLGFGLVLLGWNQQLRRRVAERTATLSQTLDTLKAAQQATQSANRQLAATLGAIPDLLMEFDLAGLCLDVRSSRATFLGQSAAQLIGRNFHDFLPPELTAVFEQAFAEALAHGLDSGRVASLNGRWFELSVASKAGPQGDAAGFVVLSRDVTERKKAESQIEALAFSDPLTGLPNRRLLMDRLDQALAAAHRHDHQIALLFIDLDNFKTLNDTLGHDKGDSLLRQVAQRLLTSVREGDTVARLGGDEFVVLLENLSNNVQDAAAQAQGVTAKFLNALGQPYEIEGHPHHSTASIGITLFGGAEREAIVEPLKRAELAMYQAKAAGRNTLRFFDPEMRTAVALRATLEAELREAVNKIQFVLHYQPQVGGDSRRSGVEALVRWQHPKRGLVSPAEFIPIAETSGLILPLGRWVMETACKQLATWAARPETSHLTMAVNVSARQFRQAEFVEDVLSILKANGANPQRLKIELTESVLVDNLEDIIVKMNALKTKGVGFSIDDFGTGYSSLSYLKRLPLDQLKIDQGFVKDILTDPDDAAIAKMVVALADSLGLSVIAEGVETEAQRDFLASLGCQNYQGYLFGKPLPIKEFEAFAERS